MCSALAHVCFGPIADTALSADHFASCAARKASDSFFSSCGVSLGGSTATVSLLIFPVNVKGGLLYLGDGHAAMGDGEAAGSAIEVPLKARVQVSVIKGRRIEWPQFENEEAIMTVGAYRPAEDAARIALTELVYWIHGDYGLSEMDAYELLSKVGKIHFNEMVDPNYVVVASIEKKYLPKKK